jgi:Cu+-exporting ATPase
LAIPVYTIGFLHFGKSAFASLKNAYPNMDVLIFTGAFSALFYSLFGTIYYAGMPEMHNYLFYETGASIVCFVLLGNLLEKRAVSKAAQSIASLSKLQVQEAKLIIGKIVSVVPISDIRVGDLIQVNEGDAVPIDGEVLGGSGFFNESMINGEPMAKRKEAGELVYGGTILETGQVQIKVTKTVKHTLLAEIIELVKKGQANKPDIQKLGDRIAAVFVPVVIGIALLTFVIAYFILDLGSAQSMLRAVAVLVISCPCAMGLATPTAVMVGIGRAAKMGILIKGGDPIEQIAKSSVWVMDKTGTLTTGNFQFSALQVSIQGHEKYWQAMIYQAEQLSSHPIAKSFVKQHPDWYDATIQLSDFTELKGLGLNWKCNGKSYFFGKNEAKKHGKYDLVLMENNAFIAGVYIQDEIKPNAVQLDRYFRKYFIDALILSGDQQEKVDQLRMELNWHGGGVGNLMPAQKLAYIQSLKGNLCMVGDGINDAPAMAHSDIAISFGNATEIAKQSAQVIVLQNDLQAIIKLHQLSLLTYKTIKQNLFWAFFYNALCIPLAAMGYMHPMLGAFSMAMSDVVVIGNSLWLNKKKIKLD